jgi:hypothetical protein
MQCVFPVVIENESMTTGNLFVTLFKPVEINSGYSNKYGRLNYVGKQLSYSTHIMTTGRQTKNIRAINRTLRKLEIIR